MSLCFTKECPLLLGIRTVTPRQLEYSHVSQDWSLLRTQSHCMVDEPQHPCGPGYGHTASDHTDSPHDDASVILDRSLIWVDPQGTAQGQRPQQIPKPTRCISTSRKLPRRTSHPDTLQVRYPGLCSTSPGRVLAHHQAHWNGAHDAAEGDHVLCTDRPHLSNDLPRAVTSSTKMRAWRSLLNVTLCGRKPFSHISCIHWSWPLWMWVLSSVSQLTTSKQSTPASPQRAGELQRRRHWRQMHQAVWQAKGVGVCG